MRTFTAGPDLNAANGNEVESTRQKRQRVTQACDQCRVKKYKCDGEQPVCSTCRNLKRECTYDSRAKKRGLQSGYVKAMECLWGLVLEQIEDSEDTVYSILERLDDSEPHPFTSRDEKAEELHDRWRRSGIPNYIDELLLGCGENRRPAANFRSDPAKDMQGGTTAAYSSTGDQNPNMRFRPKLAHTQPRWLPKNNTDEKSLLSTFSSPELPLDWQELIQAYNCMTHAWLPFIERQELFANAHSYRQRHMTSNLKDRSCGGAYAVLWGALALGALYKQGSQQKVPEMIHYCHLFLAMRDPHVADVASTQALLLLVIVNLGFRHFLVARLTLAQAIVCSQSKDFVPGDGFAHNIDRRRGLITFGCFVLDNLVAVHLDQKPLMAIDDLSVLKPCDETSIDEWEPYMWPSGQLAASKSSTHKGLASHISTTANQLISLICILNEALHHRRPAPELATSLDCWRKQLPPHLQQAGATEDHTLPHIQNLHLTYFTVCICVMKASKNQPEASGAFSNTTNPPQEVLTILRTLATNLGFGALPPLSEVFIASASKACTMESTQFANEDARSELNSFMISFRAKWPKAVTGTYTFPVGSTLIPTEDVSYEACGSPQRQSDENASPLQAHPQIEDLASYRTGQNQAGLIPTGSDPDNGSAPYPIFDQLQNEDVFPPASAEGNPNDWMKLFDTLNQPEQQHDQSQFLRGLGYTESDANLFDLFKTPHPW